MDNTEKDTPSPAPKTSVNWPALGLSTGTAVGIALGTVFDNVALGLALGLGLGAAVGAFAAARAARGQGESEKHEGGDRPA
ncbi:hypothetical protein ACIHAR_28650 [Streptomyces sp. NPDC052016]|uniref:hypothetical protein n=1 Tax=unclassified Streptomyces TaxID=2593676 RepID=UPI00344A712F